MVNVAVIGGTGYAGAELVRILSAHPHAELTTITSRQHAGQPFSDVYPAMAGIVNLTCQAFSEDSVSEAADVIFTALPHKASMGVVPGLIHRSKQRFTGSPSSILMRSGRPLWLGTQVVIPPAFFSRCCR
jgi:N-acetyl-gamma-glutamyl-phosphate reductase